MPYLLSAMGQLVVVLLLGTVFWGGHLLVARRRKTGPEKWMRWLGLYLPPAALERLWIFPAVFVLAWVSVYLQFKMIPEYAAFAGNTPAYQITRSDGIDLYLGAIFYPFVTSALTEEILFRGLIAKRLIKYLGFQWGNALQTLIFLGPHVLIVAFFSTEPNPMLNLFLYLTVGPIAWFAGWLMAKHDEGSIFGAWLIHSGVNFGTMVYFWLWVPSIPNTG